MKTDGYFDLQVRRNRPEITIEMCEFVVANAEKVRQQGNGFYQMWAFIASEEKYLRVITDETKTILHNAFFDRGYTRKKGRGK